MGIKDDLLLCDERPLWTPWIFATSLLSDVVYDYFCYTTTERLTPGGTYDLWKKSHHETWLDEAKNQMGLAHLKSHDFMASSLMFQCCAGLQHNALDGVTQWS